jgi:steroid 5-alpha reductase family enzyme
MTLASAAAIGLAGIALAFSGIWVVSLIRRDASLADIGWGLGFVALAWLYRALFGADGGRPLVVACLVTIWGVRLSTHIYRRSRGRGEDPRYAAMRARHGHAFWWHSLLTVFWLQGALLWFIALPMLVVARSADVPFFTVTDLAGLLVFGCGFAFEAIGDAQLRRFKADPASRGRVLDRGLWRYSRHPNYFGDALLWWGVYLMALAAPGGWLTAPSPALMTFLLLRVSGVTLLEEGLRATKPEYRDYIARTPAFLPWFPRRDA